jgi:hypothetical protein
VCKNIGKEQDNLGQDENNITGYQKYFSFFRMRFIAGLQYRAAALAGIVTQFVWGVMEILMYRAFYQVNPEAFPMTFQELSSYIWLQQSLLALFMTWFLENEIFQTITISNCFLLHASKSLFSSRLSLRLLPESPKSINVSNTSMPKALQYCFSVSA